MSTTALHADRIQYRFQTTQLPQQGNITATIEPLGNITTTRSETRFVARLLPERITIGVHLQDTSADVRSTIRLAQALRVNGSFMARGPVRNLGDYDPRTRDLHLGIMGIIRGTTIQVVIQDPVMHTLESRIDQFERTQTRALARALILADRSDIPRSIQDAFSRTGLMHLMAISGLHVGIIGMFIYQILGPILSRLGLKWSARKRLRSLLTLLLLLAYGSLTGWGSSVMRAIGMGAFLLAQPIVARKSISLYSFFWVVALLITIRPTLITDVGMQLSATAVGTILLWSPWLQRIQSAGPIQASIALTLIATWGTAAISIAVFGGLPLSGLLLNVPAIPLAMLALGSMLIALIIPWAAVIADVAVHALVHIAVWGATHLSAGYINISPISPTGNVILSASPYLVACCWHPSSRKRAFFLALLIALIGIPLGPGKTKDLQWIAVDVGQGDASLLITPEHEVLLIDTGPPTYNRPSNVLETLKQLGINRVHTLLITHPHADHDGQLQAILEAIPVGRVAHNGSETLMLPVPTHVVGRNDTLQIGSLVIDILHPSLPALPDNNHSIVTHIGWGNCDLLFTGDAEMEAEYVIANTYGNDLHTLDAIKVGHHGSRTSTSEVLLSKIAPDTTTARWALISAGRFNRFGHPNDEVVRRLKHAGIASWITAREGYFHLHISGYRMTNMRTGSSIPCAYN